MQQFQWSNVPVDHARDGSGVHALAEEPGVGHADAQHREIGMRKGPGPATRGHAGAIGVSDLSARERRSSRLLNARTIPVLAIMLEFALLSAVSFAASELYHRYTVGQLPYVELYVLATCLLTTIFCVPCGFNRDYAMNRLVQPREQIRSVFLHWNTAYLLFALILFVTYATDYYSRGALITQYVLGISTAIIVRLALGRLVERGLRKGVLGGKRVLLVGDTASVSIIQRRLDRSSRTVDVVGTVTLPAIRQTPSRRTGEPGSEGVNSPRMLEEIARRTAVDEIILSVPFSDSTLIRQLVDELAIVPATVHLVPDASASWTHHLPSAQVGSLATLKLSRAPLSLRDRIVKRCFDLFAGTVLLIVALPIFVIIGLLIKLDSSGPIWFRQRRHGFNQGEFRIFKFRTMTTLEDGEQFHQARQGDERITRIGRFLRRSNLDELPQLLNVLAGQMSLVGPRPHAIAHNNAFEEKIRLYAKRHNVKPGITGWSQVNGLRGETNTVEKMQKRVDSDILYIDNWSLRFDVIILFLTIFSFKSYKNAY
jgi:Undecaprenyl-phosphate glucose phosphotransferase